VRHRLLPLVALVGMGPAPALAEDDELQDAQVHYDRGSDHFRAGRYRQAVEEFRKALSTVEEPDLVWNIARSYEEMGDAPNAVHYFRVYAETWPDDESAAEAQERAEALRARLPGWIVPDCGGFAAARVAVDGGEPVACGDRIGPLKPGVHVVEATGPGRSPWKGEVEVPPEGEKEVRIRLETAPKEPKEPPPGAATDPVPPPPPPEEPLPGWVPWGVAGAGAGLAWLAAVATAKAWDASARSEAARTAYVEAPTGSEREQTERDRHAEADSDLLTWSATALGSGGAAFVCAGLAAWLLLGESAEPAVAVTPVPGGATAWLGTSWP